MNTKTWPKISCKSVPKWLYFTPKNHSRLICDTRKIYMEVTIYCLKLKGPTPQFDLWFTLIETDNNFDNDTARDISSRIKRTRYIFWHKSLNYFKGNTM